VWLDEQTPEAPRYWIRSTMSPMLATLQDGRILWANSSFQRLVEYTAVELTDGERPVYWTDLTVDRGDLAHDLQMAEGLVRGDQTEYQLTKEYKTKSGEIVPVVIHVVRFPSSGDFQCFLVTCYPLRHGEQAALFELQEFRATVERMSEQTQHVAECLEKLSQGSDVLLPIRQWANDHPRVALAVGGLLLLRVAGFSVPDILQLFTTLKSLV